VTEDRDPHHALRAARQAHGAGGDLVGHAGGRGVQEVVPGDRRQRRRRQHLHHGRRGGSHACSTRQWSSAQRSSSSISWLHVISMTSSSKQVLLHLRIITDLEIKRPRGKV